MSWSSWSILSASADISTKKKKTSADIVGDDGSGLHANLLWRDGLSVLMEQGMNSVMISQFCRRGVLNHCCLVSIWLLSLVLLRVKRACLCKAFSINMRTSSRRIIFSILSC